MTETQASYHSDANRVCLWCGSDCVDDPEITWAIKSPDKPIGLCDACAQEVPGKWVEKEITGEHRTIENHENE